jgi:hypothetical protein
MILFSLWQTSGLQTISVQFGGGPYNFPPENDGRPGYVSLSLPGSSGMTQTVYATGSPGAFPSVTWNHIAVVRNSGQIRIYLNGYSDSVLNYSGNLNDAVNKFTIGNYSSNNGIAFQGYMTNFRVCIGLAVYTSNFTPPTSPLTSLPSTQLLLLTQSDTTFLADSSPNNWTPTNNGLVYSATSVFAASPWGNSVNINGATGPTGPANKSFIIPHPVNKEKYLVHVCLEGPEAGVYYRGKAIINDGNEFVEITLPNYVNTLAADFTINITPIYDGTVKGVYSATEVINGIFRIYGTPGKVHWTVWGKRHDIEAEPDINTTIVQGAGPYKWI